MVNIFFMCLFAILLTPLARFLFKPFSALDHFLIEVSVFISEFIKFFVSFYSYLLVSIQLYLFGVLHMKNYFMCRHSDKINSVWIWEIPVFLWLYQEICGFFNGFLWIFAFPQIHQYISLEVSLYVNHSCVCVHVKSSICFVLSVIP